MTFRYTILYVDDVGASLGFFERAFGLERGFLHESGDYAESPPAKPAFELAFETEHGARALAQALAAGATLVQDVREEPWGQTTSYVSDPNGYLIEICSPVQLPSPG